MQTAPEECKVVIHTLEWLIPYVKVSDRGKIQLLRFIEGDAPISVSFRTWELYEYPLLPTTSKHVWTVKTSTQLEKPRYVILGFQTSRKNKKNKNASHFDHCNFALLYEMYANFQPTYYGKDPEPFLRQNEFLEYAPLIVIDCSKQNESLKLRPVNIRLEFEAQDNFPADTSAFCLILHDRIVEYNPISGGVNKLNATKIYVKGLEKKIWLEPFIGRSEHIVDLGDLGCPSLQKLRNNSFTR
ncbi:uncharacterized protein LOC107267062, partial [Cephus cinctus]|uniref:Uncharacterized protein LOC107267062 n=1 Tax=Cephus cinctus TaxID=211228 RepID=A0AAJ7BU48_CEPCN